MTSTTAPTRTFVRSDYIVIGGGAAAVVLAAVTRFTGGGAVTAFLFAALAVTLLAALVGRSVEQLGDRFGPGATGVLQSALGNLPELFIAIFSLQAGLVVVVQTALIGSILANSLLVLGLAFLVGGLRHGTQRFDAPAVRSMAVLLVLAVAALAVPTLATMPGAPDAGHAQDISIFVSLVLLVVFAASVPFSIRGGPGASVIQTSVERRDVWPLRLALGVLFAAAIGAAFVSDWFVEALRPAMATLGLSEEFVGLVIVAIAGNAVENVAGIVLAWKGQTELALAVVKNSVSQIAAFLYPLLVLISFAFQDHLTFVVSPVYVAALFLVAIVVWQITGDGEATAFEGVALIALYVVLGTFAFLQ